MGELTDFETAHAQSIGDKNPTLIPIPAKRVPRVLVGGVVRKSPQIVQAWLQTLRWQQLRSPAERSYCFVTDFPPNDPNFAAIEKTLTEFSASNANVSIRHNVAPPNDYKDGAVTREWTAAAWHRVGALKNYILQKAVTEAFDYVWLVDADVLCDCWTLQSLLDNQAPIVAGVYWTHWQSPQSGLPIIAGPQVWLRHPYEQSGWGWTRESFRAALIERQRVRVWGLGACTLITRSAIEKGVNFAKEVELPPGPMSDGEDRHFCWKADRLHLPMFADAWPDIFHCYHAYQVADIPKWLTRLSNPRPVKAEFGQLVSAVIRNLEQPDLPPQFVRGRLGSLEALPEVEEALASLTVGDSKLLQAHFPVHWPMGPYAGQSRLLHITMLDCKPLQLPPIIAEELFSGERSGAWKDAAAHSTKQVEVLAG